MQSSVSRTILAFGAAVLLIALVTAGCGRRTQPGGADAAPAATPTAFGAPAAPASDAPVSPVPAAPSAATPSGPPAAAVATSPVPTPDLAGIETLVNEIGQDLDADASAGTSEGSPK